MYQRILVPTDGSSITGKAIATAVGLAKALGAEVEALSVIEPFPYSVISEVEPVAPQEYSQVQTRIAQQRVDEVAKACTAAGLRCTTHCTEATHPYEAIIAHAQKSGCDLIVMASHGRRGVSALLLGSETQKLLTHTAIPVLVVR